MAARTPASGTGVKNKGLVAAAAAVPIIMTMASGVGAGRHTPAPASTNPAEIAAATCSAGITNIQQCHDEFPTGCSNSDPARYDAYLNFMKNQVPAAKAVQDPIDTTQRDFDDLNANTPAALSTGNHADLADKLSELGEGQVRSVAAFLYFAKANPGESSNCKLTATQDGDFHVLIGFDEAVAKGMKGKSAIPKELSRQLDEAAIIVEMTPFVRAQSHPNWSVAALKKHFGEPVKVVGQLMVDNEHNIQSANCALIPNKADQDASKCWRSTVWELHPVMEFYVCPKGNCSAENDQGWVALDNAQ